MRSILLQFFILYRAITHSIKMFCLFYLFSVRKQLCDLLSNCVLATFYYYLMYVSLTLKHSILSSMRFLKKSVQFLPLQLFIMHLNRNRKINVRL